MELALSSQIKEIDSYSERVLGIPIATLIARAGHAVAEAVRERVARGSSVVVFSGKGNNGADGYATAIELLSDYEVTVFDVFGEGQRGNDGRYFYGEFLRLGGKIRELTFSEDDTAIIKKAKCVIDAVFGTGFHGTVPDTVRRISQIVSELVGVEKIAVDVPIGVNADDGSVDLSSVLAMSATVTLSFAKPGLLSYPARGYTGKLILSDIDLPRDELIANFDFKNHLIDASLASSLLPKRADNSSKGSFGKLLLITGSRRYQGAAYLSLEAALRGGVGYVTYLGDEALSAQLIKSYPEVIYEPLSGLDCISKEGAARLLCDSGKYSAVLIGSGSSHSESTYLLTRQLLSSEGGPLILDADALNSLSDNIEEAEMLIKNSPRKVIITPHPLEFARISGSDVSEVQLSRIASAKTYAKRTGAIVVLKGAATVVTDGDSVYINSSGSSALAKAGSGDVLAGFLASLVASGSSPLNAAVLAVYYHGLAADALARKYSSLGVTPSDLPRAIAEQCALAYSSAES